MIDRLEVAPGPGTVIRYGSVVAWASASASPSLISFLAESARNLAPSPAGGDQLADHLVGVLEKRDPEPHVPFITVGPSENGWAALLHGPVQVWDGTSWTVANPEPGWIRASLRPRPALWVSISGTPTPAPSPDSQWDLEAGVVPGGGFVLLPAVASAVYPATAPAAVPVEDTTVIPLADTGPPTAVLPTGLAMGPATEGPGGPERQGPPEDGEGSFQAPVAVQPGEDPEEPGPAPGGRGGGERDEPAGERPSAGEDAAGVRAAAPAGVVDLRSAEARARVVAYPPLPPAGDPPRPVPGAPVVAGVPCPRGHLNRPGMATCARCGRTIGGGHASQVSGIRPPLGCLITDEGSVYRLDSGYLVGADPAKDPTVRGRLARPLVLPGVDVAASHAEIRLHDWDVVVTDRASEGGTHVFAPGASSWERLRAYQPTVLQPGTHLAFGQRVATFVTPWAAPAEAGAAGAAAHETSERN